MDDPDHGEIVRAIADGAPIGTVAKKVGAIRHSRHVLTIGPIGSQDQYATLVHTDDGHLLSVGCWTDGTIDQLADEVQRRCPDRADEYAEIEAILRRRIAEWDAEREAAS